MNVQSSLIWELLCYKFKLRHNITESTKNICCAKGEGAVDHSTVTRQMEKFHLRCKNLDDQARSYILKTMSQRQIWWITLEEYQARSSSHNPELFITFTTLTKTSGAAKLCHMLPKYSKHFWLTLVLYLFFFTFISPKNLPRIKRKALKRLEEINKMDIFP